MSEYLPEEELRIRFPNASTTCIRRSRAKPGQTPAQPDDPGTAPKLEPDNGHGTLGALPVQRPAPTRFLVRVTSRRKRLLDEDNLCEKYHVDCCRYAGLLPGDGPGQTRIEVRQEKVEPGAQEETVIEIFEV